MEVEKQVENKKGIQQDSEGRGIALVNRHLKQHFAQLGIPSDSRLRPSIKEETTIVVCSVNL
jgi:hypothetical protein